MAQNNMTEYLKCDNKMESIFLCLSMEMVREDYLDRSENLDESQRVSVGECAVDGNQQNMSGSFQKDTESEVLIQSIHQTTICPENIIPTRRRACISNSSSDNITIYYYKSNMLEELGRGVPVVLNISNSELFLKCTYSESRAVLTVECWDKGKLNSISKDDQFTWPFVFYLSNTKDNCRRFESAECSGWFIRTESNIVCMDKKDKDKDSEKYSFFISRSPNMTKSK